MYGNSVVYHEGIYWSEKRVTGLTGAVGHTISVFSGTEIDIVHLNERELVHKDFYERAPL